ncbi:MAG: flavin reductase family protein [Telmatospirillum sp.]|nr:flavin reductase family protein [Telmatospirillum sp.]
MTFDARTFRNALGCFPTGVTVVTATGADGAPVGVTISSFTSVSLSPPMVLFCLDDKSNCLARFQCGGTFAVNVLSDSQRDLSLRFSGQVRDKWAGLAYDLGETGAPLLPDCQANFECVIRAVHDGGDHRIIVGEVLRIGYAEEGKPLVYCRGRYADLS